MFALRPAGSARFVRTLLAIAAWAVAAAAATATEAPISYRLTPVLADGSLTALEVELRFAGDDDGETVLDLPNRGPDGTERWRLVYDLAIDGADARPDGATRQVLTHAPGAAITIRYRVRSAYPPTPIAENPPLKGPLLRPDGFTAPGFIFATPQGRDDDPAAFAWGPLPPGWTAASNLDHGAAGQPMTVQNVFDGVLVGGRGLTFLTREVGGARLRVAVLPAAWTLRPDEIANTLARVMAVQRAFWGDLDTPFFVAVAPMAPAAGRGSVGGFARWQGFALFAATNSGADIFEGNIAHEHTHAWIPSRIGAMPGGRAQVERFWLSEGFTEFFGARSLLKAGVWSPGRYAQTLNRTLHRYADPRTRTAPNAEILAKAFQDEAFTLAPYDRGRLLALLWDRRIQRATHGRRNLDDVVFAMRDRAMAAPPGQRPDVMANLVTTYADLSGGLDLTPDIDRYVVRGEPIVLPRMLLAPCRIVWRTEAGRSVQRLIPGDGGFRGCMARLKGRGFSAP